MVFSHLSSTLTSGVQISCHLCIVILMNVFKLAKINKSLKILIHPLSTFSSFLILKDPSSYGDKSKYGPPYSISDRYEEA